MTDLESNVTLLSSDCNRASWASQPWLPLAMSSLPEKLDHYYLINSEKMEKVHLPVTETSMSPDAGPLQEERKW